MRGIAISNPWRPRMIGAVGISSRSGAHDPAGHEKPDGNRKVQGEQHARAVQQTSGHKP